MTWIKLTSLIVLLAALGLLGAGCIGLFKGSTPTDLGVLSGRFKPPSDTDNSVSSQASLYPDHPTRQSAIIAPLRLRGSGQETLTKLEKLVAQTRGARVVLRDGTYLRAEYTSRWLGFVDDFELWFNAADQVIEVRSASRLGKKDFGVNRARVELLRVQLESL